MQTKAMLCPSCGAPLKIIDGSTKSICSYCGLESLIFDEEKTVVASIATLQSPSSPPPINQSIPYASVTFDHSTSKSWGTTLFLAITLGMFGGHRYYTGRIGSALIQTFTVGGFYIWWLIDIISILSGNFTDSKGQPLDKSKKANKVLIFTILGINAIVIISSLITNPQ